MYVDNSTVYIEDNDQCDTCEYYKKKVACPLLEALGLGVAFLDNEVNVKNCGFYKKYKRILKIVR